MNSLLAHSFLPSTAVLEMTYACNNKCLFCSCPWEYQDSGYKKDNELSLDEWKNCINILIERGINSISYTGGEPLLNKNIKEIISFTSTLKAKFLDEELEITEKKPDQYLISNGQLLDNDLLSFFKKHDVNLSLSLPGLKSYYYHTNNSNCDKILYWLKKSKEIGIHTTVNITATKKNINELYETISNALIAGADSLLLNRFLPGGRGMNYIEELFLDKNDILKMLTIADGVLLKANRFGSVGTELPMCLINGIQFKNLKLGTRCSAAIDFFVVGPEGKIRVCNHSPVQLQHFREIDDLKNNRYWKTFCQKEYLPEMCKRCDLTYKCDGGCREAAHIYTGKLNGNDPCFK